MDIVSILKIVTLIMLVIISVLLFINRKAENQNMARLAFIILLVMFIIMLFLF